MPSKNTPAEAAEEAGERVLQSVAAANQGAVDLAATVNRQATASFEQNRQAGWDVAQSVTQQVTDTVREGGQRSREAAESVGQQVIAGIQQTNQMTLDALNSWVDAVSRIAPNMAMIPFADEWRNAAVANFEFAGTLLGLQREFTENLYNTLAPLQSN